MKEPDCKHIGAWSSVEASGLAILLGPLPQLVAVLLFEVAMNTSTRFSRGATSKVLLGVFCVGVASTALHQRMLASSLDNGSDVSLILSTAENLCLPLHLALQIFLETAHGRQK